MEGPGVEEARRLIDNVDDAIIRLLDERLELCRRIGLKKKKLGSSLRDSKREREVLERAGRYRKVFEEIVRLCIEEQAKVAK